MEEFSNNLDNGMLNFIEHDEDDEAQRQDWRLEREDLMDGRSGTNGKKKEDLSTGASFRRGAELILKREGKPMDAREIVRVGLKEG